MQAALQDWRAAVLAVSKAIAAVKQACLGDEGEQLEEQATQPALQGQRIGLLRVLA